MHKLSSFTALVAVSLITITTENAWSDQTAPNWPAAPTSQAPAPGWYPPPPGRGGYAQPWQQPPRWTASPWGYGQVPPGYPPRGGYRGVPGVPPAAQNPLSAELEQAQEQLAAKSSELDEVHATLEQLRARLELSLETEQALNQKVMALSSERDILQAQMTELSGKLNTTTAELEQHRQQIADNQTQTQALSAERDQLRSDLAGRDEQLGSLQAELEAAGQALQQAQSETATSTQALGDAKAQAETLKSQVAELTARLENQQAELDTTRQTLEQAQSETTTSSQSLSDAKAQAETLQSEVAELKAQLENQQTAQSEAEQALTAERDQLRSDLAGREEQLAALQSELQTARQALQQAQTETATSSEATSDVKTRTVASEGPETGAAEIAALQTAGPDTDGDGITDAMDLCPETRQGATVEPTGCVAGAAIDLDGVTFSHDGYELTDEARLALDRVAAIIRQHSDLRLQVVGRTDAQGDTARNQWLSLQRAQTVRDYLVAQGVDARHIGAVGYGGQRPIADSATSEGQQTNQRVEIRSLR